MAERDRRKTKKGLMDERGAVPVTLPGGEAAPTWPSHMEQVLHESEERYRSLVELSPETIFVHSDWCVVYINPAGLALFAADGPETIVGKSVLDLMHPDYRTLAEMRMRASYEQQQTA